MELIIDNDFSTFRRKIFLRVQQGRNDVIIGQKDGLLVEQTLSNDAVCQTIYPLLEMPDRMVDEFLQAVIEYANKKGVKTENENLLQGKLAATEKHLEDMRINFKNLLDKTIEKL